jgi:hypothetical protein
MFNRITFAVLFALCGVIFADTIYLISDDKIENALVTEITPTEIKYRIERKTIIYTILKSDAVKIVYKDGSEDVFKQDSLEKNVNTNIISEKDTSNYIFSVGYSGLGFNTFAHWDKIKTFGNNSLLGGLGLGLVENGLVAISGDLQLHTLLPNTPNTAITVGLNPRISLESFEIITYIGFLYKQWLFNLGFSACSDCGNLSLNVGYIFQNIKEKTIKEEKKIEEEKPIENNEKPKKSTTRYFRPGIELNCLIYPLEIKLFDNSFSYSGVGLGLFFRIGPESFYFTTGAYAKFDVLSKEGIEKDILSEYFKILEINIPIPPILDLTWTRSFVEIPLLLSFGSGQIRFTSGALFDFYTASNISVDINEKIPIVGGKNLIDDESNSNVPDGNLYVVLGLDIDILRHWGIGVKCLIWGGSFGESDGLYNVMGIEPPRFQTRISTYFVF